MSNIPPPMEQPELGSLLKSARRQQQGQASFIPVFVGSIMVFSHYGFFRDAPEEVQRMIKRDMITAEASTTTLAIVRSIYGIGLAVGVVYFGVGMLGMLHFMEAPSRHVQGESDPLSASDPVESATTAHITDLGAARSVPPNRNVPTSQSQPPPILVPGDPVMAPRRQARVMLTALGLYIAVGAVYGWWNPAWLRSHWLLKVIVIGVLTAPVLTALATSKQTERPARAES
jgi:hypothetical protein